MKQWEATFRDFREDDDNCIVVLDRLGAEGWELVAVVRISPTPSGEWFRHYLKRELEAKKRAKP